MGTESAVLCTVCGGVAQGLGPGPNGRPAAACRRCGCLERHRVLALLLEAYADRAEGRLLLDVAPMPMLTSRLRAIRDVHYLGMDFDPGADRRHVDVQASLTDLPLGAGSVGMVVCFHVLEHVPDDAAAMRELARVLAPDGVALVQVPLSERATDEDPSAPPDERVRRFGQVDHVRLYGADDFVDRLARAGLTPVEVAPADLVPGELLATLGLGGADRRRLESVWVCVRGDGTLDAQAVRDAAVRSGPRVLAGLLAGLAARSEGAGEQVRTLEDRLRSSERRLGTLTRRERKDRKDLAVARRRLRALRTRPEVRVGERARAGLGRAEAAARRVARRVRGATSRPGGR